MKKYKSTERKIDMYDIGNGLTLMNVIWKNQDGKMSAIDTYIGAEGNGFTCVGHTEDLDKPGVLFSYSQYIKMIKANLSNYLEIFFTNIK